MPINNNWIKIGALVAALAVVLGGLDWLQFTNVTSDGNSVGGSNARTATATAAIFKAACFQFIHALAMILVGVLGVLRPMRFLWPTGFCFLIGTIIFSGSLYLSVFLDQLWLQYMRLAGVCALVSGWILLVEAGCPGWNKKLPHSVDSATE